MNHRHDAETYDDREGATLGRIHIERSFRGDLEGEATGRLEGREGSFVLQHRGLLSAEGAEIDGAIVAGSGTGELRGITGQGAITVDDDGTHRLTLDYELA